MSQGLTIKDTGERETYSTGAQRDNKEGKGRFDLISIQGLLRLGRWYELGSKKYTRNYEYDYKEIANWLISYAVNADSISLITPKECVETATKNGLDLATENLQKNKEKILENGTKETKIKNQVMQKNVKLILYSEKEIKKQKEELISENMDYQKFLLKNLPDSKTIDALSVEDYCQKLQKCILIISITTKEEQEDYYVVVATTVLECLETLWKNSKELLNILKIHRVTFLKTQNQKIKINISGDRNWEKGMNISRCADAAMRHLLKYIAGCDDEDHLAAVAWNVMAIMFYEEKLPEMQDLPGWEGRTTKWIYPLDYGNEKEK